MKITKKELRKIISEEVQKVNEEDLEEGIFDFLSGKNKFANAERDIAAGEADTLHQQVEQVKEVSAELRQLLQSLVVYIKQGKVNSYLAQQNSRLRNRPISSMVAEQNIDPFQPAQTPKNPGAEKVFRSTSPKIGEKEPKSAEFDKTQNPDNQDRWTAYQPEDVLKTVFQKLKSLYDILPKPEEIKSDMSDKDKMAMSKINRQARAGSRTFPQQSAGMVPGPVAESLEKIIFEALSKS